MPEARVKAKKRRAEKVTAAPAKRPASRWWLYPAIAVVAIYLAFQVYKPALNGPFVFDDISLPYDSPNFSPALSTWTNGVRPLLMFTYWINYRISQDPQGFHVTNLLIHLLNGFLIFFIVRKMQQFGSPARPLAPAPPQPQAPSLAAVPNSPALPIAASPPQPQTPSRAAVPNSPARPLAPSPPQPQTPSRAAVPNSPARPLAPSPARPLAPSLAAVPNSPARPLASSPAQPLPSPAHPLLAAFAAAVFLLHPIQTESVSYIAGRSEALSVLFFLAAFAVFLYRRSAAVSWQIAIAILALFGAAVASKEHTVVLPALLLLTDYYWNPGFSFSGIRQNWRLYLPIALGGVAGLLFIAKILASSSASAGFGLKEFTWYQYFFTQCRAFFVYLRLFVFPAGQTLDWDYAISRTILDRGAILGLVAILALVAAAIYFRRRYPLASYGFLVYILLMAPTSSFVPIKDPIAERRLYLPMIGLLLIVTAVLERIHIDRRKLAAALGAIVVVLAFLTYRRNQVWASDISVWEDAVAKSPAKPRVHFQLAHTYYSNGRYQDAVNAYAAAAQVQKPDYGLLVDWGLAYDRLNEPDEAIAKLREAAALDPTAHVYSQIGMVYAERSRWPEALEALAQAEKLDPNYDMIYDNRGGIRAKTNDLAGAAADYKHALALNPDNDHARQMLAIVEQQLSPPR